MIRLWMAGCCAAALAVAQVPASYTISTIAGTGTTGFSGDGSTPTYAQLAGPSRIAIDGSRKLYVADQFNHRIRQFTVGGSISTTAGSGTAGYKGDGSGASSAQLNTPSGVAVDSSGNYYIADTANYVIRKVTSGGTISTVAGNNANGAGYYGDGSTATNALLYNPGDVAVDNAGNLYIADTSNNVIRKVASGNISTYAGTGLAGSAGDGSVAASARLNNPTGIAVDAAGTLYIADSGNHKIRKVTIDGIITTVAGTGSAGFSGDGGRAVNAQLFRPLDVAVDASGNLYITDSNNNRVRRITADGLIATIAGSSKVGYSGDGGSGSGATLNTPTGIAVDTAGNVYFSDTQNNVIRMLTPIAGPSVARPAIRTGGVATAGSYGGSTTIAPGTWIEIYGSNLAGTTREWGRADFNGVNAPAVLDGTSVTVGNQSAFVSYVSPTQVNVQVPSNVGLGTQQVVVTTVGGDSAGYSITVATTQPALLAPDSFILDAKRYAVALFPDGTYVLPANGIPGINSRPAKPGETILLFGIGFGTTDPSTPAGQVTGQTNALNLPMQILFGQTPGTLSYSGLAPNIVGLYQFNVTVPNVASSSAVPLTFTLGGVAAQQTLYIPIQN